MPCAASRQLTPHRQAARPSRAIAANRSGGAHEIRGRKGGDRDNRRRGQDAPGPTGVKLGKRKHAPAVALLDQLPGDQEAGDYEEDVDADVTARRAERRVRKDDSADGDRARPSMSGRNRRSALAAREGSYCCGTKSGWLRVGPVRRPAWPS